MHRLPLRPTRISHRSRQRRRLPLALTASALATVLLTGPVTDAGAEETLGDRIERHMTRENIGRAVGAAAGALLGSQIGGGRGKLAAVAVGTLAGYWLGGRIGRQLSDSDRQGIATTTHQALESGQNQTWRNPDTGVVTSVAVSDADAADGGSRYAGQVPPLVAINEYYDATTRVNVRGGPGTDYRIIDQVGAGERVAVVGRVVDSDWLLITSPAIGTAFAHGEYFHRSDSQPPSGSAIRDSMSMNQAAPAMAGAEPQCRSITQQVTLPDGSGSDHRFVACRRADGTWEKIG